MCQVAWETLYNVSHIMSTLKLVKQAKLGDLDPTNRPLKTGAKETKQDYVQFWLLDTFFKSIADIMPDSNGRESQHLPEWMTYKWIYEKLCSDTPSEGNAAVPYVMFVRIFEPITSIRVTVTRMCFWLQKLQTDNRNRIDLQTTSKVIRVYMYNL